MAACCSDSGSRTSDPTGGSCRALAIDALGSGIWMPLSMLYFLHQTSLSLVQLGLAMTIANTGGLPVVPVIGPWSTGWGAKIVDAGRQRRRRRGLRALPLRPLPGRGDRCWCSASTATRRRSGARLVPMVTQITEPGEREMWFGFLQAMRNAGFGVGGVLAAVALTVGSGAAFQSVVVAQRRVVRPGVPADARASRPAVARAVDAGRRAPQRRLVGRVLRPRLPLADRGHLLLRAGRR